MLAAQALQRSHALPAHAHHAAVERCGVAVDKALAADDGKRGSWNMRSTASLLVAGDTVGAGRNSLPAVMPDQPERTTCGNTAICRDASARRNKASGNA